MVVPPWWAYMDPIEDFKGLLVGTYYTLPQLLQATNIEYPLRIKYYAKRRSLILWGEHSRSTHMVGGRHIIAYKAEFYAPSGKVLTHFILADELEQLPLHVQVIRGKARKKHLQRGLEYLRSLDGVPALRPAEYYSTHRLFFSMHGFARLTLGMVSQNWECNSQLDVLVHLLTLIQDIAYTSSRIYENFEADFITYMTQGRGAQAMKAVRGTVHLAHELNVKVSRERERSIIVGPNSD